MRAVYPFPSHTVNPRDGIQNLNLTRRIQLNTEWNIWQDSGASGNWKGQDRIFLEVIPDPPQMLALHVLFSVFLCSLVCTASLIVVFGFIWK